MRTVDLHQVDAFTNELFGGNPAGVVTNGDILSDQEMLSIAREMNLSETAFVLEPSADDADVRLRFFTPTDEVKFCGHATVGALFQLAALDMFSLGKVGENNVNVETNAGVLPMMVTNYDNQTEITFTAPKVDMAPYRLQGELFAEQFGVPANLLDLQSTVLLDKNLNYVYVPTTSLKALGEQAFDFGQIRENFSEEQIVVFCFFANKTIAPDADLHARGLAPNVGVDEDPFTGSMQAGLVTAAKQSGYIATNQQTVITEQGHFVGRPGRAKITHNVTSGAVSVTAAATPVFSTKMELK